MHGKVKLSKREIKEDKFATFVLTAKDQFMESWQYVVIGAVVVILAIAGTIFWINNRDKQQTDAAVKLSKAISDYRSNNVQVALLSLGQIVEDYSGDAVEQAVYMLGKVNLESKNFAEARKYFEQYIAKYSDDKVRHAASIAGLAGCLEGEGKPAEAAAKYLEAANAYANGPQNEEFQLAALRNYLDAGDLTSAKARLDELKKTYKGDGKVDRAELLYAEKSTGR